jgi:pimeloyl-ACP methyl ester carboxylesterase
VKPSSAISRSHLSARIAVVLAALVALVAVFAPAASAAKVAKGPRGNAFYEPPSKVPKGHGKLIWARKSTGLVPLEGAAWTKNVLYTSKSPQGDQIAVSGSVAVPEGKAPKGGWPVITWAHGTTGVADVCAPSRNSESSPAKDYISYINPDLTQFLEAGYAVLRTDYQGLGTPGPHPFLIGKSEGRGTLDIVGAADQLSNKISSDYVIAGHSQGGHASLFAAGMADDYVPDLGLHGSLVYAPASHLKEQATLLPALTAPSSLTALATLVIYGTQTANPRVDAEQIMTPETYAFFPDLNTVCEPQLAQTDSLGGIAPADLIRDDANRNAIYKVLTNNNPNVVSSEPILMAQGTADSTAPPVFTDQLAAELTDGGNDLDYIRYQGVDHGSIVTAAMPDAMEFLDENLPAG